MNILIACENAGIVRDQFAAAYPKALIVSCDLLPLDSKGYHYTGSVMDILYNGKWDMMIAHPPCTYLCCSGLFRNKNNPEREEKTWLALEFVAELMDAPIEHIAIENPRGCISTKIRPASQYIQPYQFNADASKATGLWLKNLPILVPRKEEYIEPRMVFDAGKMRPRWANQTDSGQNKLPPGKDRWKKRSETYPGIAAAMVSTWGPHVARRISEGA